MELKDVPIMGLRAHPKQHLFSVLEGSDYRDLVDSVREDGIRQPLIMSERTGETVIIDGHQRLRAAREVGLQTLVAVIQPFADEREEVGAMIASNLKRRQLTRKQKAEVVAEYIKLYAERSDNWIAEDLGVSENTVRGQRDELEATSQVEKLGKLQGKDGKERPRKQPRKQREVAEQVVSKPGLKQDTPQEIDSFLYEPDELELKTAELVGLSVGTYQRGKYITEHAPADIKEAWEKNDLSTSEAFDATREVSATAQPSILTQADLAKRLTVLPGIWSHIQQQLDALGLELVAVPKGTDLSKLEREG